MSRRGTDGRLQFRGRSVEGSVTYANHNHLTIPDIEDAPCNGSTFFIDWGSTGMKVYRVFHGGDGWSADAYLDQALEGTVDRVKLEGIDATTDPSVVTDILTDLFGHTNISRGTTGALLATGGLRLMPQEAESIWEAVRVWSDDNPGRLARCGTKLGAHRDCETLPGKEEAKYEFLATLNSTTGASFVESGSPYGFSSCGGASLQVGITGSRKDLWKCEHDLGQLSSEYDTQRLAVEKVGNSETLLLSFLSIFNLTDEQRTCEKADGVRVCDYRVGGLDQMRAGFDDFLVSKGMNSTPCLSPNTIWEAHEECSFFGAEKCVIDSYGSKISRLPPTPGPADDERKETCLALIQEFYSTDLVMSRWAASSACTGLAGSMGSLALVTGFAIAEADVVEEEEILEAIEFSEFKSSAWAAEWETQEEAADGEAGRFLTSSMLAHFLEKLGVAPNALLFAVDAEWSSAAMEERALGSGWPNEEACQAF